MKIWGRKDNKNREWDDSSGNQLLQVMVKSISLFRQVWTNLALLHSSQKTQRTIITQQAPNVICCFLLSISKHCSNLMTSRSFITACQDLMTAFSWIHYFCPYWTAWYRLIQSNTVSPNAVGWQNYSPFVFFFDDSDPLFELSHCNDCRLSSSWELRRFGKEFDIRILVVFHNL